MVALWCEDGSWMGRLDSTGRVEAVFREAFNDTPLKGRCSISGFAYVDEAGGDCAC